MLNLAHRAGFSLLFVIAGAQFAPASDFARIIINDLEYVPSTVTVHQGATVEWINKDIVEHTATARSGAFDVMTPRGKAARVKMTKAGTVQYYCRLHPNMVATINVVR
jgi:plastocyanin